MRNERGIDKKMVQMAKGQKIETFKFLEGSFR